MEQQTYEITAPNGKTLEITGDHVPTESDLRDIFAKAGVDTAPAAAVLPDVSAHAGVPARGRGTQLDLDKSNRGAALATTPLAHPTGVDAIDGFTSPVGLASLAAGGVGIVRAGVAGGVTAAAKTAIADASPLIKYEIAKGALEHAGIPSSIAMPIAMVFSGYKKGAKAEPVTAAKPRPAVPASAAPPIAAEVAPAAIAEEDRLFQELRDTIAKRQAAAPAAAMEESSPFAKPTAAPVSDVADMPGPRIVKNALPDQKALNEAALAARRAAYQASLEPAAETVVKASGKMHFTAPEWAAFRELRARGVGLEDAANGARAAGQLARQFGLSAPTAAQTTFPKGNRR